MSLRLNQNKTLVNEKTNNIVVIDGVLTSVTQHVKEVEQSLVKVQSFKSGQPYREGSGFIYRQVDDETYFVTSNFIVENADEVLLTLQSGQMIYALNVGSDISGLSVLKAHLDVQVPSVKIVPSYKSQLGECVMAMGYSKYTQAVSFGVVSGFNKMTSFELPEWKLNTFIHDATITNESNGGVLMNIEGQVIGVLLPRFTSENRNVALAVSEMVPIVDEMIENGYITRAPYAFTYDLVSDMSTSEKSFRGIPLNQLEGLYINGIVEGSTILNVQQGDILLKINDVVLKDDYAFYKAIYELDLNVENKITLLRNHETIEEVIQPS